ncbi:MAG: hypothetical protein CMA10_04690 [Euryarchaeota archaeon]|nr:hypothetical protein [Euryarchaeota archaeon]|tara:strand:+ start:12793 stop:13401 length:609 start_codon:yes stop_codon:yes gene_type:complete
MAATIGAWTGLLGQFLDELCETFDDVPQIHAARTAFNGTRLAQPRALLDSYMQQMKPLASRVARKDESLVTDGTLASELKTVFEGVKLAQLWSEIDENTRDAIWRYLQSLNDLGTTITMLPPELLESVEVVAKATASGGMQSLDPATIGAALAKDMAGRGDPEMAKGLEEAAKILADPNSREGAQARAMQAALMSTLQNQTQ